MLKRYIPVLLLASASLPMTAQYDQDISVEGKYVPEFIPRDRIGQFPKPVKFPAGKSTLDYSLGGVNADFLPQAIPIQATGWRDTRRYSKARGYVGFGLGSWLESTLSAGYRFVDSRSTVVGVRLQHNSTSLWKPQLSPASDNTRMWRYDESLGVYGSHIFEGKGRLDAAVDYHIGNFNYYGYDPTSVYGGNTDYEAPTQTLNDVSARVGWTSPSALDDITWRAAAGVRYFGYRSFYTPGLTSVTGGRETHVNLDGGVDFPTSTRSSLGIDLGADVLTYADCRPHGRYSGTLNFDTPETYGMVSLTPYYRFNRSRIDIRVGARIDLAFNAGFENDRYNTFHIAPDVTVDYNAGAAALYLRLLGGSELHTLAGDYEEDYYQAPILFDTKPMYTPLDAELGATFGPFSGFAAGVKVAWRTSREQDMCGLYQLYLNVTDPASLGWPVSEDGHGLTYDYGLGYGYNISGFSVGVNAGYDAGRYFKIDVSATYQPQNGKTGYFNGLDRPRWTADASVGSNPWKSLKLRVAFNWRGDRAYAVQAFPDNTTPLNGGRIVMCDVPDLLSLNFGASYGITDNFNVWIQADNLLNRENRRAPGLPEPGISLTAGIGVTF